jgi:hypothetical protein
MQVISQRFLITFACAAFVAACGGKSDGVKAAEARAIESHRLSWAGEPMNLDEWFAPGTEDTRFVKVFGGPAELAAWSKSKADSEGGVRAIEVLSSNALPDGRISVVVRTRFNSDATSEDTETWEQVQGRWKLSPSDPAP